MPDHPRVAAQNSSNQPLGIALVKGFLVCCVRIQLLSAVTLDIDNGSNHIVII
jgi:hypothetical protein